MLIVDGIGASRRSCMNAPSAPVSCRALASRSRAPIDENEHTRMLWSGRLFTLPGISLLVVFILARPQEFIPMLQRVPFLHIFTALAVIGYIIDVRLRRLQPIATNTLPWVGALLLWAIVTVAVNASDQLVQRIIEMAILFALSGTVAPAIHPSPPFQIVPA